MLAQRIPGSIMVMVLVISAVATGQADAAAPSPVYAPSGGFADPGVVRTNGNFYAFATGSLVPSAVGDEAGGPWSSNGQALSSAGSWATSNSIWAPDAVQTSAGWVLYYSAPAAGMNGQRCIGVATAGTVTGPYTPQNQPLICP